MFVKNLRMIYIQKNQDEIPHHFDCACAMYGAIDLGLDYKLITFEDIQSGKWDSLIRSNLFVGSVEFMTEVFRRIGIEEQPRIPYNNFRNEKRMMMEDFEYEKPVFIKPVHIKKFTGTIIDEYNYTQYKHHYPETEIIVQDIINFESEWRCYIFRNKFVDIKHYSGDLFVDMRILESHLEDTLSVIQDDEEDFPETFVIDLGLYKTGILSTTNCTVVEFNDMWAIGNYGVPNDLYVRMLKDRYFDIIKNGK